MDIVAFDSSTSATTQTIENRYYYWVSTVR